MGVISVDSTSLTWLGAECDRLAATVVSAPPPVSGGFSATSAAVRALHMEVDEAGRRVTGRLRTTGQKVSSAARGFALTEAANADLAHEV